MITGGLAVYNTLSEYKFPDKEMWFHAEGLIDILLSILILIFSKSGGYSVYLIFGIWAIAISSMQFFKTYRGMRSITNNIWITGSLDAALIVLGILIVIHPSPTRIVEHTFIGMYLLIYSVIYMVESFQLETENKVSA